MNIRKAILVALIVQPVLSAVAFGASGACSSDAAQAVLNGRAAASQDLGSRLSNAMSQTVEKQPSSIVSDCVNQIMQNGMAVKAGLPTLSGLESAAQALMKQIVQGVCNQANGVVQGEISNAGSLLTGGVNSLPYGLGGVATGATGLAVNTGGGAGNSGFVNTPVTDPRISSPMLTPPTIH
jgi:hypothetical protein